jgi:hypothetical protein
MGQFTVLKELTTADILEIMKLADAVGALEQPKEYTLADIGGPAWKARQVTLDRLAARIDTLSDFARAELAALAWLGRGDSGDDFDALVLHAQRTSDSGDSRYLAAKSSLQAYLQDGVAKIGVVL